MTLKAALGISPSTKATNKMERDCSVTSTRGASDQNTSCWSFVSKHGVQTNYTPTSQPHCRCGNSGLCSWNRWLMSHDKQWGPCSPKNRCCSAWSGDGLVRTLALVLGLPPAVASHSSSYQNIQRQSIPCPPPPPPNLWRQTFKEILTGHWLPTEVMQQKYPQPYIKRNTHIGKSLKTSQIAPTLSK